MIIPTAKMLTSFFMIAPFPEHCLLVPFSLLNRFALHCIPHIYTFYVPIGSFFFVFDIYL